MKIKPFVSIFCYPVGKEASRRGFDPDKLVQLEVEAGLHSEWAAFRTLWWLRTALLGDLLTDEMVFVAEHSTLISKARSGCAAQFLDSNCDVWLSLDDDAETGPKELALLFAATMVHHLVVLPQLRRDQSGTINVMFPTEPRRGDDHLEHLVIGARSPQFSDASSRILPIASAGCSIMAADRHALQTMRDAFPELDCHRQPERRLLALFLEEVRHAQWIGEDASFFRRAHAAGLVPKVLVDVETAHAGRHLPSNWLDTLSTP